MNPNDDIPTIYERDIAKYVYAELIQYGYVPSTDEVLDLAEIMFNFLIDLGVMSDGGYEEE